MTSAAERKAAIAAYKQRRVVSGIYVVSCTATGEQWVGSATELAKARNRIWFSLNLGRSPHASLQKAWLAHGEASFAFAEVERLPDDAEAYERDRALKEAVARWRERLGAQAI
jgi:hypothetical protein